MMRPGGLMINQCGRLGKILMMGIATENDEVWKLSYDLPGIKAKDLTVTTNGSNVQISAARHFTGLSGDSKSVKKSRIFKSFPVNSNNLSQLKANLSDGVLVISAPKKTKSDFNKITITTEPHLDGGSLEGEESGSQEMMIDTEANPNEKGSDDVTVNK
jgi:Hsp20/alpha crystallin family